MKQYVIINENLVAKEDASISIYDLGLLRGYGVFDFFKTVNNRPIWIDDHLDRFYFSAAEMNMPVPVKKPGLKDLVQELIDKNNLPDSGIRILLTGGYSEDGFSFQQPNLVITQEPLAYDKNNFEKGIRLVTYDHQRQLPHIKTTDYLQAIRLQQYVKEQNAQDLLYCSNGMVLEAPRSNIFVINGKGEIITPADHILHGITRKKILAMENFNIKASVIPVEALADASEIFIASTSKTILPVLNINGQAVGNGKPGDLTREIWKVLLEMQGKV